MKLGTREAREDADRRAAGREVRQHLRGHLLRVRADALRGDAVVGGRDHDSGPQPPGRGRPADRGDAHGEVLQPAETAARLRLGVERGAAPRPRRHQASTSGVAFPATTSSARSAASTQLAFTRPSTSR